ncbi:ThiF family adenylyltransferase [Dyella flava]|uniref:ThiF family adenylyltransferase n=1 Tax=Dyella flava TaxID=1920170 RepID=A0ABS2K081_9GAMM|nr:ThiF family adenylyltransferase [Dyella flava]MBM7124153.1 ThiF family adenylyltransferase [Dyella flava]GLQ50055.1 thiamine biosynthesis protein ThiF [Dyella flava]
MTHYSLRMLDAQLNHLAGELLGDEKEAAAIALCGRSRVRDPWTGEADERFILREVISVPAHYYETRSTDGFTWSTTPFYDALKQAEAKELAVAVFHSHPEDLLEFSKADDVAEADLFRIAFDRLDSRRPHLSVVMGRSKRMTARVYGPTLKPEPTDQIVVVGERWNFGTKRIDSIPEALDRQIRAFGDASTKELSKLKVGVVGCGGTGSAVVSLLTRIGVRQLALFDADTVDQTNLNRLHLTNQVDASLRRNKVDAVASGSAAIGLPISIIRIPHFCDHEKSLEALRSCDVVFGCTDDDLGREILNRLAHFYFIPVIDMGLLIEPMEDGGYSTFDGRVTVVQPGYPCQTCRGLISDQQIYIDSLRRDPELLEARRRAGYVPLDNNPSPAVVTFTTEVATMAVNELFHRLNGYRGVDENCSERVRKFNYLKNADILAGGKSREECKLCGRRQYDGRGDMNPLLDMTL